jgi:hypothetical protein
MKTHNLQWFIDRIGKRIYRKPIITCDCAECHGDYVDVWDDRDSNDMEVCIKYFHAHYLYDCQNELGIEYSDKPIRM